jgi:hypothetical protein
MFQQMQQIRGVSGGEMRRIRAIFAASPNGWMGQGNPAVTQHPLTPERPPRGSAARSAQIQESYRNRQYERICGERYMVPLYDPATQSPSDATVCADMFEYPNIPMVYPVVWVRAMEAAQLCAAEGKRMGDAHEWEGASAGQLLPPDYPFDRVRGMSGSAAVNAIRSFHNNTTPRPAGPIPSGPGARASAPRAASRTAPATAAASRAAGRTPIPPGPSRNAAARSASTTSTATRRST